MKYKNASSKDILPEIRELLREQKYTSTEVSGPPFPLSQGWGGNVPTTQVERYHLKKGLFLKGITGSGKTHTLYAVKSVIESWGSKTTQVENWVRLLYKMRSENFSKVNTIIDEILEKEFIFIDDIGAEKMSEWNEEILYMIINEAYTKERTLFITTNLSDEDFLKRYGERLVSRISAMCIAINMPDSDWRIKE